MRVGVVVVTGQLRHARLADLNKPSSPFQEAFLSFFLFPLLLFGPLDVSEDDEEDNEMVNLTY